VYFSLFLARPNILTKAIFSYEMIFGRTEKEMVEAIREIIKDKTLMPGIFLVHI